MNTRCFLVLGLSGLGLMWWAAGCERPEPPVRIGPLAFSADTVAFDSIFVNFLTLSERLIVTSPKGNDLIIDRIWLEAGQDTEFKILVDGIQADTVDEVLLKVYDSSDLFKEYRDDPRFPELKVGLPFFLITDTQGNLLYKTNDYLKTEEMQLFLKG